MGNRFSLHELPLSERGSSIPEFAWHTSERLASLAGAEQLVFDLRSLDPDKFSFPYHFHHNAEELFVLLEGKAMLRTPKGIEEVEAGDLLFFEIGPTGAHQLYNHSDAPCRYLDIRTKRELDVVEYPDSDKLNVLMDEQRVFDKNQQVDYLKGEADVRGKWKAIGHSFSIKEEE